MSITVSGRKMPVTDALRAYAEEKIGNSMKVMDIDPLNAEVVLSKEKNPANPCPDTCEVTLRTKGHIIRVEEREDDMYAAIDVAAAKVLRQLRKYKTRVIDRKTRNGEKTVDASPIPVSEGELDLDGLMSELSDDEVKKIIPRIRVIARALPTDKSRMVRLCQELNLVVGMTGDGVNDSPALKRADVGFAMGSGTEAAKEAGKIVILDDNFKSIKDAIWYGRTIYHNILKFCRFQLVINVAAVVVSAIAPFFGVEEPLKVTHLLFVNLVMDGLGAIMLGNEPAQERYMSEPPRRRDESIVSKSMMAQIVTMGLWLTALSFIFLKAPFFDTFFASTEQKLSAYFVLFIWSALFNAFNVRSDSFDIFKDLKLNPGFMRVFVIIVLVQAFIVNAALIPVPVFGWISNMFSCVPFPPAGWAAAILLAFTMIPVDILRKVIVGRK